MRRYLHPVLCTPVLMVLCVTPLEARRPNLALYPLHLHVLASDTSFKTPRMRPGDSMACDAIEGAVSSMSSVAGPVSLTAFSGDPCSLHPEMVTGRLLNVQDDDPVFSGEGRGDLVMPPSGTQGLTFDYNDCSRIRVRPGFQSLPARWKRPGQKLEVLVPSDEIPVAGKPLPMVRCTFTVKMHDYVYLLLGKGKLVEVTQDAYWARPGLRVFLSGRTQTIQERPHQYTISAHPVP